MTKTFTKGCYTAKITPNAGSFYAMIVADIIGGICLFGIIFAILVMVP